MADRERDGSKDFDFFLGDWLVLHKRLKGRLQGATEWEEARGRTSASKILAGLGVIDEVTIEREERTVSGFSLRLYNPEDGQWSIYWADSVHGLLQPPVTGGFDEGVGEFYAQVSFENRMVFARYIWSEITDNSCRWEQAYSEDGGRIWETNWIMEFTRK